MAIFVKVNEQKFPATITGRIHDRDWDNRSSKYITAEMSYQEAVNLFTDDVKWSIIQENEEYIDVEDGEGNITQEINIVEDEYDNSEYSVAGDIIDHRNGLVTIKMGKLTAEELLKFIEEVM